MILPAIFGGNCWFLCSLFYILYTLFKYIREEGNNMLIKGRKNIQFDKNKYRSLSQYAGRNIRRHRTLTERRETNKKNSVNEKCYSLCINYFLLFDIHVSLYFCEQQDNIANDQTFKWNLKIVLRTMYHIFVGSDVES